MGWDWVCYEWLRAVCFGDLLFLTESNVSQIESKVNGGLSTSLVEPVIQVDTKWCEILHMVDFLTYEVHHRMLGLFIPSTPQNYLKIHMSYSLCHTCGYPRSVSICKYGPFLWCVNSLKCGVVAIYCLRVRIGENADFFFFDYFLTILFAPLQKLTNQWNRVHDLQTGTTSWETLTWDHMDVVSLIPSSFSLGVVGVTILTTQVKANIFIMLTVLLPRWEREQLSRKINNQTLNQLTRVYFCDWIWCRWMDG